MQRKLTIVLAVLLIVIVAGYFGVTAIFKNIEKNLEYLAGLTLPDLDLSLIEDGIYTGSYSEFPVLAEVEVTVKNHAITGIELVKHRHGRGVAAEVIPDRVVEAQTLQVDVVTGATYSSMVILLAIEDALTVPVPGSPNR